MNIGFDAKRAFLNASGLGNYSRSVINSLAQNFSDNRYSLFTPQKGKRGSSFFSSDHKSCTVIQPESFLGKMLKTRWRSYGITEMLIHTKIDLYHGLSNELPFNIEKFHGKKIVTIHDLIFLRYPKLYPLVDRKIYNKKFKHACESADVIIAVSDQTKNDIVEFYKADPKKIRTIYQSCDAVFYRETAIEDIKKVKARYDLPSRYLLSVGTIEERKNLLTTVKALSIVKDIPLVVIGKKKAYYKKVREYITSNKLEMRILFLENVPAADMPAIYSGAEIFIYPSLFEGFGIPIIEALTCKTPVITTKGGCFSEAGGTGTAYIQPQDHQAFAEEIKKILSSDQLRKEMAEKGFEHAKQFRPEVIAGKIMAVYNET